MSSGEEELQAEGMGSEEGGAVRGVSEGKWGEEELTKFMVFLYFNKQIMCSKQQRRTLRIFKQMARFVESRSSVQCRSQHQKLMKKFKTTAKILLSHEERTGAQGLRKACLLYSKHPEVKYIAKEQPPKEKAGHAISLSTQTDFMSESFSSEEAVKDEEAETIRHKCQATFKKES